MKTHEWPKSRLWKRVLSTLAIICLCSVVMIPTVAASKYIDNATVTVNTSFFKNIDGTNYDWNHFFGICTAAGYNYNWTTGSYPDRKPLYNLTINGTLYPSGGVPPTNYKWNVVDRLDGDAYLYKKGLAGWVNTSGTYYLWYGNDTAARDENGYWLYPTYENATYIVKLDVTVTP